LTSHEEPATNSSPAGNNQNQDVLRTAIEREWQNLLTGIRIYVSRFGLATDSATLEDTAREILHDTVATGLAKSAKYNNRLEPLPWLLGIAINHIRHRRRAVGINSRVVGIADVRLPSDTTLTHLSSDEMFDLLMRSASANSRSNQLSANELLSLVKEEDRKILHLAFVEGLRGNALAAHLGISEGAALTRTSRAIARLREAYFEASEETGKK
jgi:DNA-directed RNA polymerase specialized sigma24 family protein